MWVNLLLLGSMAMFALSCEDKDSVPEAGLRTFHLANYKTPDLELREAVSGKILQPVAADAFGLVFKLPFSDRNWDLQLFDGSQQLDSYSLPPGPPELWAFAGSDAVYKIAPPALPANADELVVYVTLPPEELGTWGLHIWDPASQQAWTKWEEPMPLQDGGLYGSYAKVSLPPQAQYSAAPGPLKTFPDRLGFIVHKGDAKSSKDDIILERPWPGNLLFLGPGQSEFRCTPDLKPCPAEVSLQGAAAHWVGGQDILWKTKFPSAERFVLLASKDGLLPEKNIPKDISAFVIGDLQKQDEGKGALSTGRWPHLKDFTHFQLSKIFDRSQLVTYELMVAALDQRGRPLELTRVQLAPLLDELFATDQPLGLELSKRGQEKISVWAPTAQELKLQIYDPSKKLLKSLPMQEAQGVWSADIESDWVEQNLFYRFAVKVFQPASGRVESYEVTDPYSVSLSTDSRYSQIVDISDSRLKPDGWDTWRLGSRLPPSDMSIYELHVRDFSAADTSLPPEKRGRYQAFTFNGQRGLPLSLGMSHLKALREAGLTHVQFLPLYDFSSVPENPRDRIDLEDPFARLCALSQTPCSQEQADLLVKEALNRLPIGPDGREPWLKSLAERDSYNWGYDPYHYMVPEGSYASQAEGAQRIRELRELVQSLHQLGLRVAADVVFNHTAGSGLSQVSVLDKIVPGYYHRLNPLSGAIERSTCCENTASEHQMMERLMRDALSLWVQEYRIDAFRFDLMGHHMRSNLEAIQKDLGPDRYLYGEAWDFGEVAGGARGPNASQLNIAGLGIGSFNDRMRDEVSGGGPFDCGQLLLQQGPVQGLGTSDKGQGGLWKAQVENPDCSQPKDFVEASALEKKQASLRSQDLIRLGLLGTLSDVKMKNFQAKEVFGSDLLYNGRAAGYASSPQEILNYVQNHDNQTLWDIQQIKLPENLSMEDRVRVHVLAMSLPLLSQGVPYFEMGTDLLRSKSLYRDAYNAGDWINAFDWTLQSHHWKRNLPSAAEEAANTKVLQAAQDRLAAPDATMMQKAGQAFQKLLKLRSSSPLFRLQSLGEIQERIDFIPGTESELGLIALRLSDEACASQNLDQDWGEILVLFNLHAEAMTFYYDQAWELHPLWREGIRLPDGGLEVSAHSLSVLASRPSQCRKGMLRWKSSSERGG